MVGLVSALIVSYYLLFSMNYSGWGYSIRWFVPLLPLWFFFVYPFMERLSTGRIVIFGALFAVSTTIALIGLMNPWSNVSLSQYPLIANIKQILPHIQKLLGGQPISSIIYQ